jgi:nucleotide-binding universal stress UspA family protein
MAFSAWEDPTMYRHILIPTDGSEVSQRGVDHGLALAKAHGARATLITVTGPLPSYSGIYVGGFGVGKEVLDVYDAQQKAAADAVLAQAGKAAAALGVAAEVLHVPNAVAGDAIVEAAVSRACDLIVMSSHSRRTLGRLLLGSQASNVVNHSPVPVLVVR